MTATTTPSISSAKAKLRSQLRRQRAAQSRGQRKLAALRLVRRLRQLGLLRKGKRLAVYLASGSEMSLEPFILLAQQRGLALYAPVIPNAGRQLRFARLGSPGRWRRNRYGILEYLSRPSIAARRLHTVLTPLVGFDAHCRRLGQGGGFYDTSFAPPRADHVKLIGVAFECQRVAELQTQSHDVPLAAVVTERHIYRPAR